MINTFLSVVWDVNPNIFSIGGFELRYYGLAWVFTFGFGAWVFYDAIKRDGYPAKAFDNVFWLGIILTIVGARLGHCFFYEPAYYFSHPLQIFNIRGGGLASHGAAIGLLLALWIFSRRNKIKYIWSLDRIMLPVTIGGAAVRLGNLMNSEIYGIETSKPWGFIFTRVGETVAKHPTQIYEAICYSLTFAVLAWLYWGRSAIGRRRPGLMFGIGLLGIFVSRFFIEYIKNPQESFENNMSLMMGQWLSIPFILLGVWVIYRALRSPAMSTPKEQASEASKQRREMAVGNIKSGSGAVGAEGGAISQSPKHKPSSGASSSGKRRGK